MKIHKKTMPETAWLQLTAGQGPKECGWVVTKLYQKITETACSLSLELVESLAFDKSLRNQNLLIPEAFRSILLRIEGVGAKCFAQNWAGSVQWKGESPYRPTHKRKNWYVGVIQLDDFLCGTRSPIIELAKLHAEVIVKSMRASRPGGQHVNKTNSAVRITHKPTGIQVRVEADRSQHRNRQLALERLQLLLAEGHVSAFKAQNKAHRLNHYQVNRGQPVRTFTGLNFNEKT